jgi:tetratricopeptide (TPR) repeat protein
MCLVISGKANAQTNSSMQPGANTGSGSIIIAISGTDNLEGDVYFEEAEKNERNGDLNDAVTLFGKAAFEYNNAKNFSRYGASLLRLGNVHYLLEHYVEAEQVVLNVALKTYSRFGNRTGLMASYNQLGKIYLASNRLTQSMWFYTQQGILARQSNNNNSYIESILGLAQVKIRKKEYTLAMKDINRAELLAKSGKTNQFKGQFKQVRATIAEKKSVNK